MKSLNDKKDWLAELDQDPTDVRSLLRKESYDLAKVLLELKTKYSVSMDSHMLLLSSVINLMCSA